MYSTEAVSLHMYKLICPALATVKNDKERHNPLLQENETKYCKMLIQRAPYPGHSLIKILNAILNAMFIYGGFGFQNKRDEQRRPTNNVFECTQRSTKREDADVISRLINLQNDDIISFPAHYYYTEKRFPWIFIRKCRTSATVPTRAQPVATGTSMTATVPVQSPPIATGTPVTATVPIQTPSVATTMSQEKPVIYSDLRQMPALVACVLSDITELLIVGDAAMRRNILSTTCARYSIRHSR